MSKQVLISMLRKGSNGQEILTILDTIIGASVTEEVAAETSMNMPTLEEIAF